MFKVGVSLVIHAWSLDRGLQEPVEWTTCRTVCIHAIFLICFVVCIIDFYDIGVSRMISMVVLLILVFVLYTIRS